MKRVESFDVPDLSTAAKSEMVRYRCVGCAALSPPAETSFTLIGARYGWRLHRGRGDEPGSYQWRCPECWDRYRGKRL